MLFPLALLIPFAASAGLYLWFRSLDRGKSYWLAGLGAAAVVAAVRMGFVALGVYLLQHTSGWLQLPGYAMTLCGLPESFLMPRRIDGSVEVLARLTALVVAGSAAWVFAIAGFAAHAKQHS